MYKKKIREFRHTEEGQEGFYYLYDITGDGMPELWVSSTFGYGSMYVYTYSHGKLKLIFQGSGGHATYHKGNGYVIEHFAHQGDAKFIKLTYSNKKIKEQVIFEEQIQGDEEYKNPEEPQFSEYELYDETHIRSIYQ